ncbi:MAG: hypothetical protein ABI193_26330, partial [Minicystis sp.]
CAVHAIVILPPAALLMLLAFRRKHARILLLALHMWAEVLVAMLYFGDTRYRAPYDGVLIVLAAAGYVALLGWIFRTLRNGFRDRVPRRRARWRPPS